MSSHFYFMLFLFVLSAHAGNGDMQSYPFPSRQATEGAPVTKESVLKEQKRTVHGGAALTAPTENSQIPTVTVKPSPGMDLTNMNQRNGKSADDAIAALSTKGIVWDDGSNSLTQSAFNTSPIRSPTEPNLTLISNYEQAIFPFTEAGSGSMKNDTLLPEDHLSKDIERDNASVDILHALLGNRNQVVGESDRISLMSTQESLRAPTVTAPLPHIIDYHAELNGREEKRVQGSDENEILDMEGKKYPLNQTESIVGDRKDVSVTTVPVVTDKCSTCLQEKRQSSTEKNAVLSKLFVRGSSLSLQGNEQRMLTVNPIPHKTRAPSTFEVTTKKPEQKTVVFDGTEISNKSTLNSSVNVLDGLHYYDFIPPLSVLGSKINISETMLNDSFRSRPMSFSNSTTIKDNSTELLTTKVENESISRLADQSKYFDKRMLSTTSMPYTSTVSFHTLLVQLKDKKENLSGKIVRNQSTSIYLKRNYTQIKLNTSTNPQNTSSHLPQHFHENQKLMDVEITLKDMSEFRFEDGTRGEQKLTVGQETTSPFLSTLFSPVPPISDQNNPKNEENDLNTGSKASSTQDPLNPLFNEAHEKITPESHDSDNIDKSTLPMRTTSIESQSTSFRSLRWTTPAFKFPPASHAQTKDLKYFTSVLSTTGHLPEEPSVLHTEQQPMTFLPEFYRSPRASVTTVRTPFKKTGMKIADDILSPTVKPSAETNAPWPTTKVKVLKSSTTLLSDNRIKLDIDVSTISTASPPPTQKPTMERLTKQTLSVGQGDIQSSGDTAIIFTDSAENIETLTPLHRYQTRIDARESETQHFLKVNNNKAHMIDFSPLDASTELTAENKQESSTVHHGIKTTTETQFREEHYTSESHMSFFHLLINNLVETAHKDYNRSENLSELLEGANRSLSSQVPSHTVLNHEVPVRTLITPSQMLSRTVSFNEKAHTQSNSQAISFQTMLTKYENSSSIKQQSNQQRETTRGKLVFPKHISFSQSTFPSRINSFRDVNAAIHDKPNTHVSPVTVRSTLSPPNSIGNLYALTAAKPTITVVQSTVQPHFVLKTSSFHTSIIQQVSDQKHPIRTLTSTTSGNSFSRTATAGKHVRNVQPSTQRFDIAKDALTSDIANALNGNKFVPPSLRYIYNESSTIPPTNDDLPTGPFTNNLALPQLQVHSSEIIPFFDSPSEGPSDSFRDSEGTEERHSNASHASQDNKQISSTEAPLEHEFKRLSTQPALFTANISAGTSHDNINQSEPNETMALRTRETLLANVSLQQTTNRMRNKEALAAASPAHQSGRKLLRSGSRTRSLALNQRMGLSSPDLLLTGLAAISDDICGSGNYTAEMNLNLEHNLQPGDFVSALGILHVVINLKTNNSQVNLDIKSCCVSPTGQLDELNNTCCMFSRLPLDPHRIRLLPSVLSQRASFTIGLFQMINYSTAYLHCHLSVCLRNHTTCERQCLRQRNRFYEEGPEAIATSLRNRISFGPVLKRAENSSLAVEMDPAAEMETMLVVLGMVVGCSLVTGTLLLLWTAYRRRRVYPESSVCCGCLHRRDLILP